MTTECWNWPESVWVSSDIELTKASSITLGIDVGSVSSQAAIICDDKLYAYSNIRSCSISSDSAKKAVDKILECAGIKIEDIQNILSTGYGRFNVPFASKAVNEITCHAEGAGLIYGDKVRTVVDIGGQDCKVIKLDENGKVVDFLMNDKCASGAGWGMEIFADIISVPIIDIGPLSLEVDKEPEPIGTIGTTCYTFAISEAIGLMRKRMSKNAILAAYCLAQAHRIYTLVGRIEIEDLVGLTGGMAKNSGITKRLQKLTGFCVPSGRYDPQIAGAIGAAILAAC